MLKNRVLIIGINPSDMPNVRKNSTLHRLNKWMEHLDMPTFSFMNVITEPGEYKKEDINYDRLKDVCEYYTKILALGSFVSEALNKAGIPHYKLPHPSPRNRQFNDDNFESQMLVECGKYLGE